MPLYEGSLKAHFFTSAENQSPLVVRLQHSPCFSYLVPAKRRSLGASLTPQG